MTMQDLIDEAKRMGWTLESAGHGTAWFNRRGELLGIDVWTGRDNGRVYGRLMLNGKTVFTVSDWQGNGARRFLMGALKAKAR